MVRIIDGDIYQDNDPRLNEILERQRLSAIQSQATVRRNEAASQPAPAASGFNFSAPPFRIVQCLPGSQPLFGLPDIEIFAFRLTPMVLLALAGLSVVFGIRGFIAGGILYYIWVSNLPTAVPPLQPGGGGGGFMDHFQNGLNQLGSSVGLGNAPATGASRGIRQGNETSAQGSGQVFRGRGNRLGGNN